MKKLYQTATSTALVWSQKKAGVRNVKPAGPMSRRVGLAVRRGGEFSGTHLVKTSGWIRWTETIQGGQGGGIYATRLANVRVLQQEGVEGDRGDGQEMIGSIREQQGIADKRKKSPRKHTAPATSMRILNSQSKGRKKSKREKSRKRMG